MNVRDRLLCQLKEKQIHPLLWKVKLQVDTFYLPSLSALKSSLKGLGVIS